MVREHWCLRWPSRYAIATIYLKATWRTPYERHARHLAMFLASKLCREWHKSSAMPYFLFLSRAHIFFSIFRLLTTRFLLNDSIIRKWLRFCQVNLLNSVSVSRFWILSRSRLPGNESFFRPNWCALRILSWGKTSRFKIGESSVTKWCFHELKFHLNFTFAILLDRKTFKSLSLLSFGKQQPAKRIMMY